MYTNADSVADACVFKGGSNMPLNRSQSLAGLAVLRPNVSRLRYRWLKYPSAIWIWLLLSCGIPGPDSSVEDIAALPRQVYSGDTSFINKISTLVAGNPDGQPVIFIHGTPGSAEGWADFLINVPPGFQYMALDRPGFGWSGPDQAVVSLADQAKAVSLLFKNQSGPKPILVGHSLGAPIAAWVAATEPDAISGLVIAAGSLDPAQERIYLLQHLGASWPIRKLLPRSARNANHELMALKTELEKLQPLLAKIRVPVVIVHGTEDDLVPYQNVEYIRHNLTGAQGVTVKRLDGVNHFLPWNAKAHINAAIMDLTQTSEKSGS
jgi:pimeloyl-ACP methyl ester carboxylesterase